MLHNSIYRYPLLTFGIYSERFTYNSLPTMQLPYVNNWNIIKVIYCCLSMSVNQVNIYHCWWLHCWWLYEHNHYLAVPSLWDHKVASNFSHSGHPVNKTSYVHDYFFQNNFWEWSIFFSPRGLFKNINREFKQICYMVCLKNLTLKC